MPIYIDGHLPFNDDIEVVPTTLYKPRYTSKIRYCPPDDQLHRDAARTGLYEVSEGDWKVLK